MEHYRDEVSSAKTSGHWLVGIYRMERVVSFTNNQQSATHPDPHGPTMKSASPLWSSGSGSGEEPPRDTAIELRSKHQRVDIDGGATVAEGISCTGKKKRVTMTNSLPEQRFACLDAVLGLVRAA